LQNSKIDVTEKHSKLCTLPSLHEEGKKKKKKNQSINLFEEVLEYLVVILKEGKVFFL